MILGLKMYQGQINGNFAPFQKNHRTKLQFLL